MWNFKSGSAYTKRIQKCNPGKRYIREFSQAKDIGYNTRRERLRCDRRTRYTARYVRVYVVVVYVKQCTLCVHHNSIHTYTFIYNRWRKRIYVLRRTGRWCASICVCVCVSRTKYCRLQFMEHKHFILLILALRLRIVKRTLARRKSHNESALPCTSCRKYDLYAKRLFEQYMRAAYLNLSCNAVKRAYENIYLCIMLTYVHIYTLVEMCVVYINWKLSVAKILSGSADTIFGNFFLFIVKVYMVVKELKTHR